MEDEEQLAEILSRLKSKWDPDDTSSSRFTFQSITCFLSLYELSNEFLCSVMFDFCLPALSSKCVARVEGTTADFHSKVDERKLTRSKLMETIVQICRSSTLSAELMLWLAFSSVVETGDANSELDLKAKVCNKQFDIAKNEALKKLLLKTQAHSEVSQLTHLSVLGVLLRSEISWNSTCSMLLLGIFKGVLNIAFDEDVGNFELKSCLSLFPAYFSQETLPLETLSTELWHQCEAYSCCEHDTSILDKKLIIFCSIMDTTCRWEQHMSPVLSKALFWHDVGNGLASAETLTRKRSIFILKNVLSMCKKCSNVSIGNSSTLFWWYDKYRKEQLDAWERILLFYDTLEEKQNHIITPVLDQYKSLEEVFLLKDKSGLPLVHPFWLETIFKRALSHESRIVSYRILEIILTINPMVFAQDVAGDWDFILHSLLPHLNQVRIYDTPTSEPGALPSIVSLMSTFLSRLVAVLPSCKGSSLIKEVANVTLTSNFSKVPTFYLTYALKQLDPFPTAFDDTVLTNIKVFFRSGTVNYPESFKNGVAVNVLQAIQLFVSEVPTYLDAVIELTYGVTTELPHICNCSVFKEFAVWTMDSLYDERTIDQQDGLTLLSSYLKNKLEVALLCKTQRPKELDMAVAFSCLTTIACHNREVNSSKVELLDAMLRKALLPIYEILSRLLTSPYLNSEHIETALTFFTEAIKLNLEIFRKPKQSGQISLALREFVLEHLNSVLSYCLDNVFDGSDSLLDCSSMGLDSCLLLFQTNPSLLSQLPGIQEHLEGIVINCVEKLRTTDRYAWRGYKALRTLNWICRLSRTFRDMEMFCDFGTFLAEKVSELNTDLDYSKLYLKEDVGCCSPTKHADSDYIIYLWSCIEFYISFIGQFQPPSVVSNAAVGSIEITLKSCSAESICNLAVSSFDLVQGKGLVPLLKCVCMLLPQLGVGASMEFVLEETWRLLSAFSRRDSSFWDVFTHSIDILFHEAALKCNQSNFAKQWEWLITTGQEKRGIVVYGVLRLCVSWRAFLSCDEELALRSIVQHLDVVKDACIFGPVHKSSMYITDDASDICEELCPIGSPSGKGTKGVDEFFAELLGNTTSSNSVSMRDSNARVVILSFLCSVNMKFASLFVHPLLQKLAEQDLSKTDARLRYFPDSSVHRQKIRTWQTVLVFLGCLTKEQADEFVDLMYSVLLTDNLPMVRHMNEWIVVILLSRFPHLFSSLWHRLSIANEKRLSNLASLLVIVYHSTLLLRGEEFEASARLALNYLLPWTQVQHVGARMSAFAIMEKLWDECVERKCTLLLNEVKIIKSCFTLNYQNSCALRHRSQYKNDFFLSVLRPLDHLSFEVIFKTFLEHSGVCSNERMTVEKFGHLEEILKVSPCLLKLCDGEPNLGVHQTIAKVVGHSSPETDQAGTTSMPPADVQKKITTLSVMPPLDDTFLQSMHITKRRSDPSLIVCATLIDRPANLGGLCRTCEILGASTFVVGSYHYIEDSNFKALSVTSEKWMNIEQVTPRQLADYIVEMKSNGYSIVGVEQTAQSVEMQKFKFEKKTLLLLGNEKEGIPVRLIQQMDSCIEIPQSGIIRSLNVHTSGAIVIWEYCKQKLLN